MRTLTLERTGEFGGGTIGRLFDGYRFLAYSLERLWMDNQRNVSCIPDGDYLVELEFSAKFKRDLYELRNVPGRTEIKFHASNYPHELQGCIALGSSSPNESFPCRNSRHAIAKLHEHLDGEAFMLHVRHGFRGVDGAHEAAFKRDEP